MTVLEVIASGLILFVLIVGGTIAYVAVKTTGARTEAQRQAGINVLKELRQMARDVLDAIRDLFRT